MLVTQAVLWALVGAGINAAILMRLIWLPDPPPPPASRVIGALVGGVIGGVIGGALTQVSGSDPMPGIVGAAGGGLVVASLIATLAGGGERAAG